VAPLARVQLGRLAPPTAGLLLALFALLVRAAPFPTVFAPAGIFPNGPDAYYHLRRIAYTVVGFPRFLGFDPYVSFPEGGRPIWPPLFDFTLAALARLGLGAEAGAPLERLLMWAPPLLGAACVLALFSLARRAWGPGTAGLAALLLALLPAHFVYSQLGELDHHAAVALAVTWVLAAALTQLRAPAADVRGSVLPALGFAASAAFALLLWPGCLLAVATSGAALLARTLTLARRDEAVALARRCACAHALAFAIVTPFAVGSASERWGSVSPVVLSWFQPLYLASGAACFASLGEFFQRVRFPEASARRALVALVVGGGVLALCLAVAPGLVTGAGDAWVWLAKRESFQATVAESMPLLRAVPGFESDTAEQLFSRIFWATPLMIAWLALRRGEGAAARRFVAFQAAVWLVAALAQRRFVNELSIAFALAVALCATDAVRAARRALTGRQPLAAGALLASLAAALWLLAPIAAFYSPWLANVRRALADEPPRLSGWQVEQRALTRLARWLGQQTPPTAGWWDASQRPEYGLLAAWGDGHVLRYVARRPVVQDNFGDDVGERSFALAEAYFSEPSEAEALRIAGDLRARYVVVRGGGSGHSRGYDARSQFARLHKLKGAAGSFGVPGGDEAIRVPALAHHRLIFDADAAWGPSDGSRPSYKVFEIVPGARIAGRASPGAEVAVVLRIAMGRRGRLVFSSETRAGPDGRYEIIVPYANDVPGREIRPGRSYELRSGSRAVAVSVSDAEVRQGARVEAPPLAD
jgi:asparagine N-glycosylation enzyme membrane subunit Stt3